MYKKLALLLLAFTFIFAGCKKNNEEQDLYRSILKRDKLVVGVKYDSKPFGFMDTDSKLKGLDVDLGKEIARRMLGDSSKVEFKQVSPATRIQSITSGEVDLVIATMSITPQRELIIDFSNPYYIAGQAIVVPEKSKINSINDLNNENVIVILGTTGEKNLRYFAPGAIVQGYRNNSNAFEALRKGHASILTTDDAIIIGFLMDNKGFKMLPRRITKEPYGIAFKKTDDTSLKLNLNRILDSIRADGTLNKLAKKWELD